DDFAAGGAAHNGIVNQYDPLAFEQRTHRIQLELHAKVTNRLSRFDKSAAHIVIADKAKAQRDAAFGRKAHGRGNTGVGHRHNDVGIHGSFKGQLTAKLFTTLLHETAENDAVRPGKINVLENAARLISRRSVEAGSHSLGTYDDQFAGFYFALVGCADQIKGAGFRRKNDCVLFLSGLGGNASHSKRPKAARVASGENTVRADHDQRECAFHAPQSVGHGFGQGLLARLRDEMYDHFSIAVGLEDRALRFHAAADFLSIDQIAIVSKCHHAFVRLHHDGLGI